GLFYLLFRLNYRGTRMFERVRLTPAALTVERHDLRGRVRRWSFQPYWLRVTIDDPPEPDSPLLLSSHGRSLAIGGFLPPPERLGAWRYVALFGLFGMVIPFALISWGETRIDSGLTAILMAIIPLVTVLLAHFLQHDERLSGGRLVGVVLGLGGVLVLVGPAALARLGADLAGQLAVCAASLTYAVAGNLGRRIPPMPADVAGSGALLCAAAVTVPAALLVDHPWQLVPTTLSLTALVILGVLGTAGGYI